MDGMFTLKVPFSEIPSLVCLFLAMMRPIMGGSSSMRVSQAIVQKFGLPATLAQIRQIGNARVEILFANLTWPLFSENVPHRDGLSMWMKEKAANVRPVPPAKRE
jgi:hypothetical protein